MKPEAYDIANILDYIYLHSCPPPPPPPLRMSLNDGRSVITSNLLVAVGSLRFEAYSDWIKWTVDRIKEFLGCF